MVYCGKPSRGCQNCKTRRIKCDEVRPTCTQCKKSNRSCPGYPDEFDLIFRNETLAVKRRAQRAFSASKAKNSKPKAGKKTLTKPPKVPEPVSVAAPFQTTFVAPVVSTSITPGTLDIAFQPEYEAFYSTPPSLDDAATSDSNSSNGSPPSEIQDDESYVGSHSDALVRTPTSSNRSSPIILDSSPVYDRYHQQSQTTKDYFDPADFNFGDALKSPSILPMSGQTLSEYTAIPYFFRRHVLWERHADSQTGYLELLPKMYGNANASPLLHTATYAVSLGIMSNALRSKPMRCEARKQYGKALQNLGHAIKDVNLATADEIIMTILLFVLYEQIMGDLQRKIQWTSHIHGAVALVKMRAKEQLSSPMSIHLFRAVRSLMLKAAVQKKIRLEEFPDDKGWRCDEELGPNTANRLTLICLDIPDLKATTNELVDMQNRTPKTIKKMLNTIEKAQQIEYNLEAWARSLPPPWEPWVTKIVTEEPRDVTRAEFWSGPVYSYQNLNIACITNEYRTSRVLCNGVVRDLIQALPHELQTEPMQRAYTKAIYVARQMCNDFCSTLPYMLGHNYYMRPGACPEDEQSAKATGAFFSAWPIIVMRHIHHIPEMQRKWIGYRLLYICTNYGLRDPEAEKLIEQFMAQAQKYRLALAAKHQSTSLTPLTQQVSA